MNSWSVGERVAVTLTLTDPISGVAVDPGNPVQFHYQMPGAAITRLTYGTDIDLQKTATGKYAVELDCGTVGVVSYRWMAAAGSKAFAVEGQFQILSTTLQ